MKQPPRRAPRFLRERVRVWQERTNQLNLHLTVRFVSNCRVQGEVVKACATWEPGYSHGVITFNADLYDEWDEELADHLCCHEVLHFECAEEDDALAEYVGRDSLTYKAWSAANEKAIDRRAVAMRRLYRRKP